ncbi:MAG: Obg family GTPase CgtA [Parcubacteria group bacterium Gr01-1014_17]|nr:MAG: Obg family GTPase CgtA [Parcubacteria group bacterium Gr01-1014_17]
MAFVDEITLRVNAGAGGDGVVRWLHEKGKEYSGPAGGNGGKGGDVYTAAVRDINRLAVYRSSSVISAENGDAGQSKNKHGADGADTDVMVPVGSLITIASGARKGRTYELLKEDARIKILFGGRGGLGNKYFKGSRNTRPMQFTHGKAGEAAEVKVELRLIADAGLIGLPNAGKSSLLNAVTAAHAKVGAYQFTTLEPNLGELHGYILADIPGLIEGASEGKGLGHKFLRHIARTKVLLHCISLEQPDIRAAYEIVRTELSAYNDILSKKLEIVVLTKTDISSPQTIESVVRLFKKMGIPVLSVSVLEPTSISAFKKEVVKALKAL